MNQSPTNDSTEASPASEPSPANPLAAREQPATVAAPAKTSSRKRRATWLIFLLSAITSGTGYWVVVRFVFFNFHEVVPGQVYRCAQPSPAFLEKTVQGKGIRSILKMNKNSEIAWAGQEAAIADKLGVRLIELPLPTRRLLSRQELLDLIDRLENAPRPLLIHCKAGADRTGVASAIIAMISGQSFDQAVDDQLRVAYLHVGYPGEDIADVLWQYKSERLAKGLPTAGWKEFSTWANDDYFPGYYHAEISGPVVMELAAGIDRTLFLPVTVTNASPIAWPVEDKIPMLLGAFYQPPGEDITHRILLGTLDLPAGMKPGDHSDLRLRIKLPSDWPASKRQIVVDVMRPNVVWFSDRGSPALNVTLILK